MHRWDSPIFMKLGLILEWGWHPDFMTIFAFVWFRKEVDAGNNPVKHLTLAFPFGGITLVIKK
jgi:hypothetical protein